MPHAEWFAAVAIGTSARMYDGACGPEACWSALFGGKRTGKQRGHSSTDMPPMLPPTTAAICSTPRKSSSAFCTRTSSRTLVEGNSGPHHPCPSQSGSPAPTRRLLGLAPLETDGSPPLRVQGLLEPYGEPKTLAQTMKKRVGSNSLPGPISGPHL